MSRYTVKTNPDFPGYSSVTDNGPSGPHEMTDRELVRYMKRLAPNNANQMEFADRLKECGEAVREIQKRRLHIKPGVLFSEEEQWEHFVKRHADQPVAMVDLFLAGLEAMEHPGDVRIAVVDLVEAGRKRLQDLAKQTPAVRPEAGRPTKEEHDNHYKNENVMIIDQQGNSAAYRIAKLKRDYPDVAARIAAGEFKTVSEAERSIGLRPPKMTALERVQRAYAKLDENDRNAFRTWLGENLEGEPS